MNRVRVKICGITSREDLEMVVEAGADAVGFVVDVPHSQRNISIRKANRLIESTPVFVGSVAVIVPEGLHHLRQLCQDLRPSLFQIHGKKQLYREIREDLPGIRVIGAIKAKKDFSPQETQTSTQIFDAVLIDSHLPGRQGGTGRVHDWRISKRVKELLHPKPLILAGGLSLDNIKRAVQTVRPYAVDVSTGVESKPGIKDQKKVNRFIKNAKEV
ncbi:MAG: phosphoribosylanthranilate isomerase [Thermoproteota archaeon]